MSTTTTGSALVTLLESDLLVTLGPQLLALLTAEKAANGDPIKSMAAWVAFLGAVQPALLTLEATVIGQVIGLIQGKLSALVTAAQNGTLGTMGTTVAPNPAPAAV